MVYVSFALGILVMKFQVYSDYYNIIKVPISMSNIQDKVKKHVYDTVAQYAEDWCLLFWNARTYNIDGSDIYCDAERLRQVFKTSLRAATEQFEIEFVDDKEDPNGD
ncbi:Bromodomain-containing protein [Dendrothele bispora CBS 962.96]|uniref:Bromodomain-containing protein n=1 Tax=Dendrothele bispora (strain CBS 962.96) TaxID=1314807 RepID=A0A4S8MMQ7_DENBC|nr:Bromodomain-containing protein [Dendrothele bispora CBS 962.96]